MAAPSLTYTLTNGTTADASQVMQNFNDLLLGYTDGTKDLSINALTVAGTATLNGNINLGNSTSDDITITGSLASSFPVKTQRSYDIGSADLGLRTIYLGGNSTHTSALSLPSSGLTGDVTFTLPPTNGTANYLLSTDGSGVTTWIDPNAGVKTYPSMPYALATITGTYNAGSTTMTLSEVTDTGNNLASNTFTAPAAGRYLVTCRINLATVTGAVTGVEVVLLKNGSDLENRFPRITNGAGGATTLIPNQSDSSSMVLNLAASDTITLRVAVSGGTSVVFDGVGYSSVTITKLH